MNYYSLYYNDVKLFDHQSPTKNTSTVWHDLRLLVVTAVSERFHIDSDSFDNSLYKVKKTTLPEEAEYEMLLKRLSKRDIQLLNRYFKHDN